jgi:zinc transport system substrate-binding protein
MGKLRHGVVVGLACLVAVAGCAENASKPSASAKTKPSVTGGPTQVLCSFFPMYLFTKAVVGDREGVDVALMLPPEMGCPHDYDLTPADQKKILASNVFVMNGAGLEEFTSGVVKTANPDIIVIDTSKGINGIALDDHGHDHDHDGDGKPDHAAEDHDKDAKHDHDHDGDGKPDHDAEDHKDAKDDHDDHDHDHAKEAKDDHGHDHDHDGHDHDHHHHGDMNPHFFSSPDQAIQQVRNIAEGLAKVDPKGEETYRKNAAEFSTRLAKLSEDFKAKTTTFPNRKIVTMHEVFDYLARDYGLEVVATIQEAPGLDPSAGAMRATIEKIKESKPAAIFTEPQYSERSAEVIAKESGTPVFKLDPVASGPADAGADYYETKMRENLATLEKALGGPSS